MLNLKLRWVFVLLFLIPCLPWGTRVDGRQPVETTPGSQANWWTLSDVDFITQYGNLATGSQQDQSRFAWMTFARANQQVPFGENQQKYSQWELWASDLDTFSPNVPRFEAAKKIRVRPHLQPLQQLRLFSHRVNLEAMNNPFPQAGQEVTRNPLSYSYIMDNHLNTQSGIAAFLGQQGNRIQFPQGVVETKAWWVRNALPGAYQVAGLSLTALHLMVKVKPTPQNPFLDNNPSWFWTTFELKTNQGLADAQKFISYHDALSQAEITKLLTDAGLGSTPFVNYVSMGQQIQFGDAQFQSIILGNTKLEWPFATPPSQNPATWTSWSSSCHSCHGQASGQIQGSGMSPFSFTAPVGPLTGNALPPAGYQSYDFVWALALAQ